MNPAGEIKVLSLFSGCGGMDLGFEGGFTVHPDSINSGIHPEFIRKKSDSHVLLKNTGFTTVFANDIREDAMKVWRHNFPWHSPGVFHLGSIVDLVKEHYCNHNIFPEKVDIVTGGFPCQDFSLAGKRNGFYSHKDHRGVKIEPNRPSVETRGRLYMWMKEVIDITRPKIFVAENVRGLVNLSNIKNIIQKDFSTAGGDGYIVPEPVVLNAADFGVPQARERVIFIGIRKSALKEEILQTLQKGIPAELNPYPEPTHSFRSAGTRLKEPVRLKQIFENLEEPAGSNDLSHQFYSGAKYMGRHCQGQTEIVLDGIGPTIRSEHHGNIEFRRLSRDHGGKLLHENLPERRLSPRECALIQTFPRDFQFILPGRGRRFEVSPSSAYKLIGNAVPPLLAYHLAMRIRELWDVYFE